MAHSQTTSTSVQLYERLPTFDEYCALCVAVGWGQVINFAAAPQSLANSLYGVVALAGDRPVGMGRLVGDGAIYFYVQDVAVDPLWREQGIGQQILQQLLTYVRHQAVGPVFVGLFATPLAKPLYERQGFAVRDMEGLFQVIIG